MIAGRGSRRLQNVRDATFYGAARRIDMTRDVLALQAAVGRLPRGGWFADVKPSELSCAAARCRAREDLSILLGTGEQ